MPILLLRVAATAGALYFGGLFIYAGFAKIWDQGPLQFTDDIRSFHLLEDPWVAIVALFLPWVEILCGGAVVLGPLRKGGLAILTASLVVFLIGIAIAWHRGIDLNCGCFGKTESHSTNAELFWRDIGLLALGSVLLLLPRRVSPYGIGGRT
ncbi:MAG: hypothetical protein KA004_14340 [Verrucomicrobiales bacterium]|nr:hypothetical protein [Verrucomicrobiales bacterium]